jgi:hypothetical protein
MHKEAAASQAPIQYFENAFMRSFVIRKVCKPGGPEPSGTNGLSIKKGV